MIHHELFWCFMDQVTRINRIKIKVFEKKLEIKKIKIGVTALFCKKKILGP